MTFDQGAIFSILAVTMTLFVWGRWRYDIVAVIALLASVFLGLVSIENAFAGFGHPAVITVAAVLVISEALKNSGIVDSLARLLVLTRRSTRLQIGATTGLAALLSAFMNNVGALALMLPVALRNASKGKVSPSAMLMPLSFASLLGGLVTLIGTPPNIVIANFRVESEGAPFEMFDFALVGLPVAVVGLLYITIIGWRLVPDRRGDGTSIEERFNVGSYITEATVPLDSRLVGAQVRTLEQECENEATVMTILRGSERLLAPRGADVLKENDILLLEGDPQALQPLFEGQGLVRMGGREVDPELLSSADVHLVEAVVMPQALIEGQSMRRLRMHDNFGINLLAMARQGGTPRARLSRIRFRVGDVLLLQGERDTLRRGLELMGCMALARRGSVPQRQRRSLLPLGIFATAIAAAAAGIVPIQIAFVTAVVVLVIANAITPRAIYRSIEWPVIVLLGALIPVGEALKTSGGTFLIGNGIIAVAGDLPVWIVLAMLMAVSMMLSDLVHNTPTAVLMAPIALTVAQQFGLSSDAFLMAVAVGAASPYLTPIGHQSNTLVMAPGGYHFSDYWRMGLPLDILIIVTGVPMILWAWT